MSNKVLHHYDDNHLPVSAKQIVPLIMDLVNPNSVIDVGCGLAQWLKVFSLNGVDTILGIDGNHVSSDMIYIDKINFQYFDLERSFDLKISSKFDLVLSLEVAEHISEKNADEYVELLSSLGDRILFSAAIPFQTGENHVNEQNHIYWQEKFLKHDFLMLDIIRPKIWNNNNINWWYRQNMFLLVKVNDSLFNKELIYNGNQLIHPELLKMYVDLNLNLHNQLSNK
jgi:SAM-dependent methyltransferase